MFRVGLTGGIGSGKSCAAEIFKQLGICVVDADQAARAVVQPGSGALQKIAQHFGDQVITTAGELDRKALREKVFSDATERHWLEALLHPLIHRHINAALAQANSIYAVLESPLLLESGQYRLVNRILVIDAPEALQLQRTLARDGGNEEQVKAIIAAQMDREQRLSRAQDVILNAEGINHLEEQIRILHQHYLKLAEHDT